MGREGSEIWQVGYRAVSKRDTSFSAWLRDNDEPQIRMNEKVLRNLSATLQRPMLCQGCWTRNFYFPAENAFHISYTSVIMLHLVMQNKSPWNDICMKLDDKMKKKKNYFLCWIKHALCTWCLVSWQRSSHLEAVKKKHRRGTKGLNSLLAAEWAWGALCLQNTTANAFKSRKERE